MEVKVYNTKIVNAIYVREEKLVQLRWMKEANTDEYRLLFQALVDFAQKNKVRFIISDMRRQGLVTAEDVKWLEEEIFKEAIVLGIEKIALINDDTIFSNVYAETIKRKLLNSPIRVQLFGDLTSAKAWLTTE